MIVAEVLWFDMGPVTERVVRRLASTYATSRGCHWILAVLGNASALKTMPKVWPDQSNKVAQEPKASVEKEKDTLSNRLDFIEEVQRTQIGAKLEMECRFTNKALADDVKEQIREIHRLVAELRTVLPAWQQPTSTPFSDSPAELRIHVYVVKQSMFGKTFHLWLDTIGKTPRKRIVV